MVLEADVQPIHRQETDKLTIISAGFSAVMAALLSHLEYRLQGKKLRITMIGDQAPTDSPASNLCASITHNEILAVTPTPAEAKVFIEQVYTSPGGLAASLEHLKTPKARAFIDELYELAKHPEALSSYKAILEKYGEYCMLLWERIAEIAAELEDQELSEILRSYSSLRIPAGPGVKDNGVDNYRVDIYVNTPAAITKTAPLVQHLQDLGYSDSRLLSPDEYLKMMPYGHEFVQKFSQMGTSGEREWCDHVSVARRPAGRINAYQFMQHITDYLERHGGKYKNDDGEVKSFFRVKKGRVSNLIHETSSDDVYSHVTGVEIIDPETHQQIETHRQDTSYGRFFYVVNTGSRVHAAEELGVQAPNSALFAGTYMQLKIPMAKLSPEEQQIRSHLALRSGNGADGVDTSVAQFYPDPDDPTYLILHIAGTKTFCGDTEPVKQGDQLEPFAYDRLLIQLNMLRDTFPNLLRPVLNDKVEKRLTREELDVLVSAGVARVGIECRNVSTTNTPYVGPVVFKDGKIASNAGLYAAPSSAGIAYVGNVTGVIKSAMGTGLRLFEKIDQREQTNVSCAAEIMSKISL